MSVPQPTPVLSPCIGLCQLDVRGYCVGCQRTGDEIGRWLTMSDGERLRLMHDVLPQRESHEDRESHEEDRQ